ncbi:Histone deacetylase complex subunit 2/3 [Penicillium lagena]|uniref:Histone deacetylase complex subunit 2/3 n=1 Tax=Penicillium lagena TaxID=94218 RepID=UPI002541BB27|nr:Histone deacetylase complex subunit 2/3 [Penicillium lagena]KAJ5620845.1 Histone deacetylase complex subunit 2/3 [Penicillium lagena]
MVRADTRFWPPTSDRHCKPRTDSAPADTVCARVYSDSSELDDDEWPIKCILQETDTEYLIDWEGPYTPSWVSYITQIDGPASPFASQRRRDSENNERAASEHENQSNTRGSTVLSSTLPSLEIVPETQYSPQAKQSSVSGTFSPETPGAGHSSVRSEIAETPSLRHEEFKSQLISHESSIPFSASSGSVEGIETNSGSLVSHYLTQCDSSVGVYLSSIPETVTQYLSQYQVDSSTQFTSQPGLSLPKPTETQPRVEIVEDQGRKHPAASMNENMDQYNSWDQPRAPRFPGISQTLSASGTPSSVGDIESSVPVSASEAMAPLSVRLDKDAVTHSHTAIHHVHAEPLIPPSELLHVDPSTTQTIQPSELTVTNVEENLPGSIRLGPSEFAVTLPMDSRVKDYYERVLADAATSIREFFSGIDDNSGLSAAEVRLYHI